MNIHLKHHKYANFDLSLRNHLNSLQVLLSMFLKESYCMGFLLFLPYVKV